MIEETGTVVAVEGDHVWVETQVKTTCGSCKASQACPTSTIAKAFTPKPEHIYLEVPCALVVGQQVKLGISEKALLYASLMVYIVPLITVIVVASAVMAIVPSMHELLVLGIASFSALASFWWASAYAKQPKNKRKFTPVFLGATQNAVSTHKHEIPMHKVE
jgi:sigma-E factor negative regulatory protein RseC